MVHILSMQNIAFIIPLQQGSPNYSPQARSGLPYTFIRPANMINKCF
jgi:hypothetical protein